MNRLYDIKVDERRWKIVKVDSEYYNSYKLIDKDNEEVYFLNHIIGFEQVTGDEFLVYRRINYDDFEIGRYRLQNSKISQLFVKRFSKFYFISDDKIMFSNWGNTGPYRCSGVYSIKDNKMLDEAKWLDGVVTEVYTDDNDNEIKLFVEEKNNSYELGDPKLLFTVDPDTLQPNSDCYSEFRNVFIKVSSKEDIENIKVEEQKMIRIMEEQMFQQKYEQLQNAKKKLLVRKR